MNRFEQRLRKRLQNEEVAAGYREMAAELELLSALELTADITLRQAREGEGPIKVAMELPPPQ